MHLLRIWLEFELRVVIMFYVKVGIMFMRFYIARILHLMDLGVELQKIAFNINFILMLLLI